MGINKPKVSLSPSLFDLLRNVIYTVPNSLLSVYFNVSPLIVRKYLDKDSRCSSENCGSIRLLFTRKREAVRPSGNDRNSPLYSLEGYPSVVKDHVNWPSHNRHCIEYFPCSPWLSHLVNFYYCLLPSLITNVLRNGKWFRKTYTIY